MEEEKRQITEVEKSVVFWYDGGQQCQAEVLRIYARPIVMVFDLDDDRLPADIECNWQNYLLCSRRFEPGKPRSRTGLTSVWFEAASGSQD